MSHGPRPTGRRKSIWPDKNVRNQAYPEKLISGIWFQSLIELVIQWSHIQLKCPKDKSDDMFNFDELIKKEEVLRNITINNFVPTDCFKNT